ncbi:class I SAM-dependent methyltransferase [Streptomyces reniochalinae]|uniref:Class I SAM-dependent methyltransferase n=1 Tax=Streptomyces reniochalinae TaxID=2250578 RepID=A0A367EF35_9ACTN|nr:methyltransferase domain-containing protein [Streptomyces reniochalinae]RCG16661.1 class I SAM-dependent methyltransferase [Streptomyces reniochalinae]
MIGHELVARQLEERIAAHFEVGRRLRVLDVALGDGAQALRLARGGHQVTGLESDPGRLAAFTSALETEPEGIRARFRALAGSGQDTGAHFLPGTFDLVLCHGVLDRAKDPDSTLAGLARVLDSGGLLSLVIPNAAARAMRPGLAGDWRAARAALVAQPEESDRFLRLEALTSFLARIGVPMECWYGVGVFAAGGSHGAAGAALWQEQAAGAADEATAEAAAAVEELACRMDPYRGVAPSLHLFGVRG